MPDQLDAFLADGTQPTAAPEPPPPTEPTPAPTPEAKPEAPAKPRELDEEHEQLLRDADNGTVPRSALEQVRRDWKSKYAAEQARTEELRRQLEEAKRAASAPPPPPPPQQQFAPPPDVTTDPLGWARHLEARHQQMLVNERLNMSEAIVSQTLPKEKLDEYVADFRQAAARDPSLWGKLYSKPSPYHWLTAEVDRLRMQNEIGNDPAAYRARIAAEERAKWEAEMRGSAPSPAAGLPPSLANARSVAGRTTSTFTGPPDIGEIVNRPRRAR